MRAARNSTAGYHRGSKLLHLVLVAERAAPARLRTRGGVTSHTRPDSTTIQSPNTKITHSAGWTHRRLSPGAEALEQRMPGFQSWQCARVQGYFGTHTGLVLFIWEVYPDLTPPRVYGPNTYILEHVLTILTRGRVGNVKAVTCSAHKHALKSTAHQVTAP